MNRLGILQSDTVFLFSWVRLHPLPRLRCSGMKRHGLKHFKTISVANGSLPQCLFLFQMLQFAAWTSKSPAIHSRFLWLLYYSFPKDQQNSQIVGEFEERVNCCYFFRRFHHPFLSHFLYTLTS